MTWGKAFCIALVVAAIALAARAIFGDASFEPAALPKTSWAQLEIELPPGGVVASVQTSTTGPTYSTSTTPMISWTCAKGYTPVRTWPDGYLACAGFVVLVGK